jgi:hypothetical protein
MRSINSIVGFAFSMTLVTVLALPTLRWLDLRVPDGVLYGYTDEVPPPPTNLMCAFFDKSLQHWVEKYFEVNLGFRPLLIRSFNELNFRFFHEAPKLRLYTTQAHGLYSKMSLESLNDEVVRRKELEERYHIEAEKLLRVQRKLQSQGKYFEVVIGTSKPYVYPNGLGTRYLVGGSESIFERAASFGKVLREAGVNVIDGGPLLREFVAKTGVETHPASGVHWNYYAGCLIASQLLDNIRARQFPKAPMLDCGLPQIAEPHMIDLDGLLLLNIWSTGGVAKLSPYPKIKRNDDSVWRPNIIFIGDSFSDQIRYALQQSNVYSRLVTSGYFRVREIDDRVANATVAANIKAEESVIHEALMKDIASSDVIILQMVDYNVQRWGYGFADYILKFSQKKR